MTTIIKGIDQINEVVQERGSSRSRIYYLKECLWQFCEKKLVNLAVLMEAEAPSITGKMEFYLKLIFVMVM